MRRTGKMPVPRLRSVRLHVLRKAFLPALLALLSAWSGVLAAGDAADPQGKDQRRGVSEAGPQPLRPALGPYVRYDAPGEATVRWETDQPTPSTLVFGTGGRLDRRAGDATPKKSHRVVLARLAHGREYAYQLLATAGGKQVAGATCTFDTTFNYCPPPLPDGLGPLVSDPSAAPIAAAAEGILRRTGVRAGYCLVYGLARGQLAWELARRTKLTVLGVDDDPARVAEARKLLRAAGAYGPRITVRHVASLAKLPLTRCFANLVVSGDAAAGRAMRGSAAEAFRVLRPAGGMACFGRPAAARGGTDRKALEAWLRGGKLAATFDADDGLWATVTRGPLPGAGQWTHQYGGPGNSAYGGEALGGATRTDQMQVQWIGRPGGDFGLDRNPRMPAPLSVSGRLFHQGMNRIIALDAYNGTVLWVLEVPDLRRVNLPRDASNWCADARRLYVAVRDRCWVLDAPTGRRAAAFPLPEGRRGTHEWGYVARVGDKLLGSSVRAGAAYTDFWGHAAWYDDRKAGPGTRKVCSDDLFALDPNTGREAWRYVGGAIINTAVAAGDGRVYLVESRNAAVAASPDRRVGMAELWRDLHLVALSVADGTKLWDRPIDTAEGTFVFYLSYAEGKLLVSCSTGGSYHLYTYDAAGGKDGWQAAHKWASNNHSGHLQHPVVVEGKVFLEPCGYDLKTGVQITSKMGKREGCSTYAAVAGALVHRGQARRIAMWDTRDGTVSSWHNLRPSCWLSVIPAAGMILAPEGGGGCSCGNWLQTSLGLLPKPDAGGEKGGSK